MAFTNIITSAEAVEAGVEEFNPPHCKGSAIGYAFCGSSGYERRCESCKRPILGYIAEKSENGLKLGGVLRLKNNPPGEEVTHVA